MPSNRNLIDSTQVSGLAAQGRATGRFALLDDYEIRHVVTHIVRSTQALVGRVPGDGDIKRAAQLLVSLVGDPGFAIAQSERIGAERTVSDFVVSYEALERIDLGDAQSLARSLAIAAVLDSTRGKPVLSPDTLHALLGYRSDQSIYRKTLEYGTNAAFVAAIVQDPQLQALPLIGFLHSSATRQRRFGGSHNLAVARKHLIEARLLCERMLAEGRVASAVAQRLLSAVLYDLAYIGFLTAQPQAAQAEFRGSAEAAKLAGHLTGYFMSRTLQQLVGFYDGTVTVGAFRTALSEALRHFESVANNEPHARRWVMNAHAHLFDVACIVGDLDAAEAEFHELKRDPWVELFGQSRQLTTWTARYSLLRMRWQLAIDLYQSILAGELNKPSAREGAARDLLDYGLALSEAGDSEKARSVWKLGLRCPDDSGNWPWKPRITQRMAALGVGGNRQ